jgi:hypothetical protein
MAKKSKTKKTTPKLPFLAPLEQKFSFDTEAVLLMAALGFVIRNAVQDSAVEMSKDKMCISKSTVTKAIEAVGLGDWIAKIEEKVDMKCH